MYLMSPFHPAFLTAKVGSDTKSEALLALEDVTAVAGVDGVDGVVLRPVADVSLFGVGVAGCVGTLDPVSGIGADRVKDSLTDSGDDVHVADDIDGVGDFQAVLCERGTDFAHAVRDDIHGLALVAATDDVVEGLVALIGIHPVVQRAGLFLGGGADEGSVFNTSDIVRVGSVEVAVGKFLLVEFDELAGGDSLVLEGLDLLLGPVDPDNFVRLEEVDSVLYPVQNALVVSKFFHETSSFTNTLTSVPCEAPQNDTRNALILAIHLLSLLVGFRLVPDTETIILEFGTKVEKSNAVLQK